MPITPKGQITIERSGHYEWTRICKKYESCVNKSVCSACALNFLYFNANGEVENIPPPPPRPKPTIVFIRRVGKPRPPAEPLNQKEKEELFGMIKSRKYTTGALAQYFNLSQRTIQVYERKVLS